MEERLQKLLAQAGLCSRREAERWIDDGRVTVNGKKASVGDKADPRRDKIFVDGKPIGGAEDNRCFLFLCPSISDSLLFHSFAKGINIFICNI